MRKITAISIFFCLFLSNNIAAQFSIQKALLEVFTGAWCQYCADGYVKMEDACAGQTAVFAITIHNGDAMAFGIGDSLSDYYAPAYPQGLVNRGGALISRGQWQSTLNSTIQGASVVTVSFDSVLFNPQTRVLDVYLDALFTGPESGDLRFNCILVEDSVIGSGSGYNQVNADNNTVGHPYYNAGNPIVGFAHRYVAREYLGGLWGVAGIIPGTVNFGSNIKHHFSTTVPANFQAEHLSLIGIVSKYGSNITDREILNVEKALLPQTAPTALQYSQAASSAFDIFPNPAFDGHCTIVCSENVMANIYNIQGQLLNSFRLSAGENNLELSFPKGVYFVQFNTGKASLVKKLVLE